MEDDAGGLSEGPAAELEVPVAAGVSEPGDDGAADGIDPSGEECGAVGDWAVSALWDRGSDKIGVP